MKLFSKIILKFLKQNNLNILLKNPSTKIGNSLKIGNYCNFSLYDDAKKIAFGNNIYIRNYCNFLVGKNAELILEDRVFMNNYCSVNCLEKIEIGENTLFGEGVKLYDHNHQYDSEKVEHQKFNSAPIKIGKNCWLGSNVTVLKGVEIGDNCIIGAGCVIFKNVEANSIIVNEQNLVNKSK